VTWKTRIGRNFSKSVEEERSLSSRGPLYQNPSYKYNTEVSCGIRGQLCVQLVHSTMAT